MQGYLLWFSTLPLGLFLPSSSSGANQCDNDGDSHSQDHSDESGDDESGEDNQRRKKKAKFPTRKRWSNSSAAERLQFLHSYSKKREKEKLVLLKSMKDD